MDLLNFKEKLYQLTFTQADGSAKLGNYFIDQNTYNRYFDPHTNTFDVARYCRDAQIAPNHHAHGYNTRLEAFDVPANTTIHAEHGTALNNSSYGSGGARQYFLNNDEAIKLQRDVNYHQPEVINNYLEAEDIDEMLDNGRAAHDQAMVQYEVEVQVEVEEVEEDKEESMDDIVPEAEEGKEVKAEVKTEKMSDITKDVEVDEDGNTLSSTVKEETTETTKITETEDNEIDR